MDFERIGEAQVNGHDDTFALINRGYTPDVFKPYQWFETTEDLYTYFLEVLPPLHFSGGAFMMCERCTDTLSNAFLQSGTRFFCLTVPHSEPFSAMVQAFRTHLYEGAEQ
ncbi:hypothetical protein GCM10007385_46580 [Tateyamaria omphalii]|uniref:DUF1419 domain-containing protein n=1 Tax=Tateyamaria omphalii TaxID=299262 RepID=UPI00167594D6|nr:DUF1419 domain-containing protein [Tateyamaria omphalii]GGX72479.1 hypothetical protein GCM10007385_46580 [Tateyamaria omphalii]